MKKSLSLLASVGLGLGIVGAFDAAAKATAITTPVGLTAGENFYVVFVTDTAYNGTAFSSDPSTYDTIVQADATANDLTYNGVPVTAEALVSTYNPTTGVGTNAVDRFDPTSGVYLIDGAEVAGSGAALWGTSNSSFLSNAIDLAPSGATVDGSVWTGSFSNGDMANNAPTVFYGLGSGSVSAFGSSGSTGQGWGGGQYTGEQQSFGFYAFSQELTVPVPEPASLGVLAVGAVMGLRRRKRV